MSIVSWRENKSLVPVTPSRVFEIVAMVDIIKETHDEKEDGASSYEIKLSGEII